MQSYVLFKHINIYIYIHYIYMYTTMSEQNAHDAKEKKRMFKNK